MQFIYLHMHVYVSTEIYVLVYVHMYCFFLFSLQKEFLYFKIKRLMLMWAVLANALDEIGKSKILKQRVICISSEVYWRK